MALVDNCKAHYTLDEASGTIFDSTPNNHDSTSETGITYGETGQIGDAVLFNGNDNVIITRHADFQNPTGFSVNFWINLATNNTFDLVFNIWGSGGSGNASWWVGFDLGKPSIATYDGSGGASFTSLNQLGTGSWHMITFVYDGGTTGTNAHLYVDGSLDREGTLSRVPQTSTNYDVRISSDSNGANHFDATLDELAYFDTNLSLADHQTLWNGGIGITYPFAAVAVPRHGFVNFQDPGIV